MLNKRLVICKGLCVRLVNFLSSGFAHRHQSAQRWNILNITTLLATRSLTTLLTRRAEQLWRNWERNIWKTCLLGTSLPWLMNNMPFTEITSDKARCRSITSQVLYLLYVFCFVFCDSDLVRVLFYLKFTGLWCSLLSWPLHDWWNFTASYLRW